MCTDKWQGYMLPFSSKMISIYCRYPGLQDCLCGMTQPISYSRKKEPDKLQRYTHRWVCLFFGQKTSNMSPVHVVTGWQRYAFQWTINEKSYIPSGSEGHLFKLRSGLNFEDMVNQACLGRCLIKPPQKNSLNKGSVVCFQVWFSDPFRSLPPRPPGYFDRTGPMPGLDVLRESGEAADRLLMGWFPFERFRIVLTL